MALGGKRALGGTRRFCSTGHAAPISSHHLEALGRGVAIAPPLPPRDRVHGGVPLRHIGLGPGIEGLLHDRWFGTTLPAKGGLQAGVRSPAFVDLYEAVRACQDRDQGIIELLPRGVGDRFLANMDVVTHRPKQGEPLQSYAQSREGCTGRKTV